MNPKKEKTNFLPKFTKLAININGSTMYDSRRHYAKTINLVFHSFDQEKESTMLAMKPAKTSIKKPKY